MVNSPSSSSDEEEEQQFYESLDRILSSSSPSTSASDDDGDRRSSRRIHPRFPPISAASFDVWISEPSSVEERRRRLLQQMGLSGDPSLSRVHEHSADSRSEAALPTPRSFHRHRPSLGAPSTRKPPLFARPLSSSAVDFEGVGGDDAGECKIKNLDTGREFVVKEVREDGMWEKLREVGTGRHLSMEEFEISVGVSPIVQELMRRQIEEAEQPSGSTAASDGPNGAGTRSKRRGGLLKSIKNVVGGGQRRSSDEKEKDSSSSERGGGRRSSSTTDDSQDGHHGPARAKVRNYGKPQKELTGLFMSQEIKAHDGSIWSIKFSFDGRYLASAGEDCVIHVWKVSENERKGELVSLERGESGSPDPLLALACVEGSHWEKMKKRRAKVPGSRRSSSSVDQLMVPEYVFALSDKPVCSFRGHLDDVLDLSWSKSEYLLSSSMDKTVKLWNLSSNSCLQTFTHSDYVTCIQFNPVDDRYFISGSLDEKVRIWSIPDRQIVDWNDLHEMITAACYTPDGQSALVGSHKGCCHLYNTSENKLHRKSQIDLKNKKKKSNLKKITGFKFAPGSSSQVLITSADSRIRFVDGVELVHKFKGFRNTSSQISASFTANRKYVVCASEDSHVYVWRCDAIDSRPNRTKGCITETNSYEQFHCSDVTVATPWPTASMDSEMQTTSSGLQNGMGGLSKSNSHVPNGHSYPSNASSAVQNGQFGDRAAATWPEEKLYAEVTKYNSQIKGCSGDDVTQGRPAWGMVIVTAGRGGQIRTYQNFGFRI